MQHSLTSSYDQSRTRHRLNLGTLSLESALHLLILAAAVVSRFWDLSRGALHHDESMHAYYSWIYATGGNYIHDPLLHGPLLFHLTALSFLLFGESDTTARLMPALFGVILVGLPWLLRGPRFLGRWGALTASTLLLVSPSILYYSRHLRHDMFTLTLTLLLFICIVRYIERPQRRWLMTGAASTALTLANHEIIFAIIAIFAGYLYLALAFDRIGRWWHDGSRSAARLVLLAHAVALLGLAAVVALAPTSRIDALLDIPWDNPTRQQQLDYYRTVFTSPVVLGAIAVLIVAIAILLAGLRQVKTIAASREITNDPLLGDGVDRSLPAAVRSHWRDRDGLGIALLIVIALFAALFTTLFTNIHGLATSTIATNGTLLYWLGQHDVKRGSQPWFYFLVLAPQYELFVTFFGVGGLIAVTVRSVGSWFSLWSVDSRRFFRGFVAFWFAGIFTGLSFAGEKMPWLTVHFALPGILLAAIVIGPIVERGVDLLRQHAWSIRDGTLLAMLSLCGVAWFAIAANVTRPEITIVPDAIDSQRIVSDWGAAHWWLLAIPPAAALVSLVFWSFWRGPQRTAIVAMVALMLGLGAFQVHAAWRMTYLEGDIPLDMMIYTQTAPDMTMQLGDLETLSYQTEGDLGLKVYFGGEASWPTWWYMRDFTAKQFAGTPENSAAVPDDAAVYIVDAVDLANASAVAQIDSTFAGYTRQVYVLRWAFPETDTYRNFAIAPELEPWRSAWGSEENPHGPGAILGSIFDSIDHQLSPAGQQDLYRLLVYRDLTTPLTSWDTRIFVYIRNDLLPTFNAIRY